jgi:hypothetical protein
MGINDLLLTPELIAILYPDSLISEKSGSVVMKEADPVKQADYPYLGANRSFICFLVNYPGHPFIPADALNFLEKIMKACKFTLDDIAIINTANQPVEMADLRKQIGPMYLFLWGAAPAIVGKIDDFPDMQIADFDGIPVMRVLMVNAMTGENAEAQELKQKLWAQLKKLFRL